MTKKNSALTRNALSLPYDLAANFLGQFMQMFSSEVHETFGRFISF
jgi:hypothetical protein